MSKSKMKIETKEIARILDRLARAEMTIDRIKAVLQSPAEDDEHGNSAYKADKPLAEIRGLLESGGYIKSSKVWPMPRIENMDDGVKVPRFVESRT